MAITGNIYLTGSSAALIGGIYWKKASKSGAFAALLGGLISLAGIIPAVLNNVSMGVLGLGNFLFCGIMLFVFSIVFPDKQKPIDKEKKVRWKTG